MERISTVYAVFPDQAEAERIAAEMVQLGLAACVNIHSPCRSVYWWDGKVTWTDEIPVMFKVATSGVTAVIDAIAERSSYTMPAIVAWPIEMTHPAYAKWVHQSSIQDSKVS